MVVIPEGVFERYRRRTDDQEHRANHPHVDEGRPSTFCCGQIKPNSINDFGYGIDLCDVGHLIKVSIAE
jgi:hypothetical protein